MAPRRSVGQSKKARYGEGRDSDTIDRLSDLPDVVLHLILSSVPIKEAVRTSLLSKRWQHLWLSIPKLSFCQRQFRERSNFMNLVDRALLLRDSFSVEEFTLSCDAKSAMVRINSWIACVLTRNVRKLSLNICPGQEGVVFPSCLFRCETLTRLRISFGRRHDLIMPSSVCLSSLKDLRLERVRFVDYGSVQNMLLSCPALESLSLDHCHWMGLNGKTISAPNLQRLTILEAGNCCRGCCPGKMVINGPNVKFFDYTINHFYAAYRLVGSSSLTEARLSSSLSANVNFDWDLHGYSKLVERLYIVRSLTLSPVLFRHVTDAHMFEASPNFCNVTKLKVEAGGVFLGTKAFDALLRKSPCLRILEFSQSTYKEWDTGVSRLVPEPAPPCFESQLKTIIVHCHRPTEVNLDWIELLLKKAKVLEEMVLYYVKTKEGDNSLEHLKKLPRGSKDCKISLIGRFRFE